MLWGKKALHLLALEAGSANNIEQSQDSHPLCVVPHQSRGHHDWASERKSHMKKAGGHGHEKSKVFLSHNNSLLWEMIHILMGTILMPSRSVY